MEKERYSTIALAKSDFSSEKDFQDKLSNLLETLWTAGYVTVVQIEDYDVYRIDFNYAKKEDYGNPLPVWLSYEEQNELSKNKMAKEMNEEDD